MKIICKHCGSKARITHSRQVFPELRDIYVKCLNPECGGRYLLEMKYKYDITPPKNKYISLLDKYLSEIPPQDREKLIAKYS